MLHEIKQFSSKVEYSRVKEVLEKACRNNELRKSREGKADFDDISRNNSTYEFYDDRSGNTWLLIPPENNHNGSLRLYSSGNEPIPYRAKPNPLYQSKAELDALIVMIFFAIGFPVALIIILFKWLTGTL